MAPKQQPQPQPQEEHETDGGSHHPNNKTKIVGRSSTRQYQRYPQVQRDHHPSSSTDKNHNSPTPTKPSVASCTNNPTEDRLSSSLPTKRETLIAIPDDDEDEDEGRNRMPAPRRLLGVLPCCLSLSHTLLLWSTLVPIVLHDGRRGRRRGGPSKKLLNRVLAFWKKPSPAGRKLSSTASTLATAEAVQSTISLLESDDDDENENKDQCVMKEEQEEEKDDDQDGQSPTSTTNMTTSSSERDDPPRRHDFKHESRVLSTNDVLSIETGVIDSIVQRIGDDDSSSSCSQSSSSSYSYGYTNHDDDGYAVSSVDGPDSVSLSSSSSSFQTSDSLTLSSQGSKMSAPVDPLTSFLPSEFHRTDTELSLEVT